MPGDLDDLDGMAKDDIKTIRNSYHQYKSRGGMNLTAPVIIEYLCWGVGILSLIFMVVAMPFTGTDGAITGEQWLTVSLMGLLLGGGGGFGIRLLDGVVG